MRRLLVPLAAFMAARGTAPGVTISHAPGYAIVEEC